MDDTGKTGGKIGLTEAGQAALGRLQVARTGEDLAKGGIAPEVVDAMLEHGLLEPQDTTTPPLLSQDVFSGWKSQRGMLIDHTRTLAFDRALRDMVNPGDVVIDVGTGSGILAMMAARAGAGKSWALEFTAMADWAEKIARANGLDAMQVVRGDAGAFVADRPANVVIGEFLGMYVLEEWRHYAAFVKVREANLKPGGQVIPRATRLYLSAIDDRKLYRDRGYGFWEEPVYGFDFSPVREGDISRPQRYITTADARSIVTTGQIAEIDFLHGTEADYLFTSEITLDYPSAGNFHGLIGHFELDMGNGQILSTSPFARETCWHQSYFPMPAIRVPAGGQITVRARSFLDPDGDRMRFGLTVAGPGETVDGQPEHVFAFE